MFFVQHQFEDTYYAKEDKWDYTLAALQGSSYYQLPKVLQWFTGNIGFHHIHHLSPRIPNYRLQKCHEENPVFQQVVVLTLWTSLQSIFLSLWDEEQGDWWVSVNSNQSRSRKHKALIWISRNLTDLYHSDGAEPPRPQGPVALGQRQCEASPWDRVFNFIFLCV